MDFTFIKHLRIYIYLYIVKGGIIRRNKLSSSYIFTRVILYIFLVKLEKNES